MSNQTYQSDVSDSDWAGAEHIWSTLSHPVIDGKSIVSPINSFHWQFWSILQHVSVSYRDLHCSCWIVDIQMSEKHQFSYHYSQFTWLKFQQRDQMPSYQSGVPRSWLHTSDQQAESASLNPNPSISWRHEAAAVICRILEPSGTSLLSVLWCRSWWSEKLAMWYSTSWTISLSGSKAMAWQQSDFW